MDTEGIGVADQHDARQIFAGGIGIVDNSGFGNFAVFVFAAVKGFDIEFFNFSMASKDRFSGMRPGHPVQRTTAVRTADILWLPART